VPEQLRSDEEINAAHIAAPELHNAPIYLAPYTDEWPLLFQREATRIHAALGDRVRLLEHVGSTSVPGLSAKPKIDVLLVVDDSSDEASYVPPMESVGYVLRIREPEWHQHRLFKGPDTDVNIHVHTAGCAEIDRMLQFRDHLRSNETDRLVYEHKKQELAQRTWKYVQHYADAKSAVVEDIVSRTTAAGATCATY
jgi:GrpB-like predicted nucleotidyltransferase (UPF0157 family)